MCVGGLWLAGERESASSMDGWMDIGHIIIPVFGLLRCKHARLCWLSCQLRISIVCAIYAGCVYLIVYTCVCSPPRKFDSGVQHSTAHTHDPCYCLNIELDHQRLFLVFSPPPSSYISPNDECIVAEYCCAVLADGQQLLFLHTNTKST